MGATTGIRVPRNTHAPLSRRSSSPFDLFDRLEQPLSQQLQAVYRDGLFTVTAPMANRMSTMTVKVER
jgi:hypothetical protein